MNGTRLFGSFRRKFPGATEHLQGSPVSPGGIFQTEIRVPFTSKPSLIPGSGLRGRFLVNGTDLYKW